MSSVCPQHTGVAEPGGSSVSRELPCLGASHCHQWLVRGRGDRHGLQSPPHTSGLHPTTQERPQGAPPPSLGFPFAMCLWPPVPCGGVWAGAAWARRPPLSPCWWAVARASRAQQASGFPTSLAVTSDPGVTEDAELGPRVFHRLVNGAEHRLGISRAHRPPLRGAPSLPSTSSPPSLPDTPPASAHHPSPPWAGLPDTPPADGGSPPSGF